MQDGKLPSDEKNKDKNFKFSETVTISSKQVADVYGRADRKILNLHNGNRVRVSCQILVEGDAKSDVEGAVDYIRNEYNYDWINKNLAVRGTGDGSKMALVDSDSFNNISKKEIAKNSVAFEERIGNKENKIPNPESNGRKTRWRDIRNEIRHGKKRGYADRATGHGSNSCADVCASNVACAVGGGASERSKELSKLKLEGDKNGKNEDTNGKNVTRKKEHCGYDVRVHKNYNYGGTADNLEKLLEESDVVEYLKDGKSLEDNHSKDPAVFEEKIANQSSSHDFRTHRGNDAGVGARSIGSELATRPIDSEMQHEITKVFKDIGVSTSDKSLEASNGKVETVDDPLSVALVGEQNVGSHANNICIDKHYTYNVRAIQCSIGGSGAFAGAGSAPSYSVAIESCSKILATNVKADLESVKSSTTYLDATKGNTGRKDDYSPNSMSDEQIRAQYRSDFKNNLRDINHRFHDVRVPCLNDAKSDANGEVATARSTDLETCKKETKIGGRSTNKEEGIRYVDNNSKEQRVGKFEYTSSADHFCRQYDLKGNKHRVYDVRVLLSHNGAVERGDGAVTSRSIDSKGFDKLSETEVGASYTNDKEDVRRKDTKERNACKVKNKTDPISAEHIREKYIRNSEIGKKLTLVDRGTQSSNFENDTSTSVKRSIDLEKLTRFLVEESVVDSSECLQLIKIDGISTKGSIVSEEELGVKNEITSKSVSPDSIPQQQGGGINDDVRKFETCIGHACSSTNVNVDSNIWDLISNESEVVGAPPTNQENVLRHVNSTGNELVALEGNNIDNAPDPISADNIRKQGRDDSSKCDFHNQISMKGAPPDPIATSRFINTTSGSLLSIEPKVEAPAHTDKKGILIPNKSIDFNKKKSSSKIDRAPESISTLFIRKQIGCDYKNSTSNDGRGRQNLSNAANGIDGKKGQHVDWSAFHMQSAQVRLEKWSKYPKILKDFYNEKPEVANLTAAEVGRMRIENNNTKVSFPFAKKSFLIPKAPNPIWTFEQCFDAYPDLIAEIKKQGFKKPSPIQSQAWPILLRGHDLIGISQAGTGKTLAFLLPAMIHTEHQITPRGQRDGPNVLILAPTRELAMQIESEVKKYSFRKMKAVCVYGGVDRKSQMNDLKRRAEIIICTPGRLSDLLQSKIINISAITFLILDEADRMLDMGFEPLIRKVMLDIRPDRQTVMTSATWPLNVCRLAENYMNDPFQVSVESFNLGITRSVTQVVKVMSSDEEKFRSVKKFITKMKPYDKAIIFCGRKGRADDLSRHLSLAGFSTACIHGNREQHDREEAISYFKAGRVKLLVATDIVSRGLDIVDVNFVINYDLPQTIEEYVHRVGRTGRDGRTGVSISYLTRDDRTMAHELIEILKENGQTIPEELLKMAERYASMARKRGNHSGAEHRRSGARYRN